MPRQRDPRRDQAKEIWLKCKGDIKLVDLAEQFNVTSSTIRKWKATDKWDDELKGNAPNRKKSAPKRKGGQPSNKNAVGHGAPKRNSNAVTHGLFAKYLPKETLAIVNQMGDSLSPLDILWSNIQMQFAAILRAQQIMFVEDKDEMIKELKKEKESFGDTSRSSEKEWEFQFAWDRHATFMNSQSRAMGELRSMLKQFIEMAEHDDDRLLEIKRINAVIDKAKADTEKTKAEIEKLGNDNNDNPIEIMIRRKGDRS